MVSAQDGVDDISPERLFNGPALVLEVLLALFMFGKSRKRMGKIVIL
jgi:hypothetical protein